MTRFILWAREVAWFSVLAAVLLAIALVVMFFHVFVALVLAILSGTAAVLALRQ